MTTVFVVVGQHHQQPERLLLLGEDGDLYSLSRSRGRLERVRSVGGWEVDHDKLPVHLLSGHGAASHPTGQNAGTRRVRRAPERGVFLRRLVHALVPERNRMMTPSR